MFNIKRNNYHYFILKIVWLRFYYNVLESLPKKQYLKQSDGKRNHFVSFNINTKN